MVVVMIMITSIGYVEARGTRSTLYAYLSQILNSCLLCLLGSLFTRCSRRGKKNLMGVLAAREELQILCLQLDSSFIAAC
jgi:hypothetical protein